MLCIRHPGPALALVAAGWLVAAAAHGAQPGPVDGQGPPLVVVIGAAGGASGSRAAVGQDHNNGVILAAEELNRRQLRIGGRLVLWKVEAEDDQGDPRQAASVAQKFIDRGVAAVVGHDTSGATYAAMHLYAAAGVPMLVAAATDARLASMGSRTFYRVIGDDRVVAAALARYAHDDLRGRRVATIDDRTAYGQGLADGFSRAAEALGLQVVAREYTEDHAVDFSAVLTRLRGMRLDAILYGGVYAQGGLMLRQMRNLGMSAKLLAGDGTCVRGVVELAGPAIDRLVCGESGLPLDRMPEGIAWKQRYDRRFGAAAFQSFSPYAYDATMLLARAMVAANSVDPARYQRALRGTDHDGVTREHIRFLPDGNLASPQVTLSVFRGGRKVALRVESIRVHLPR